MILEFFKVFSWLSDMTFIPLFEYKLQIGFLRKNKLQIGNFSIC
jgi:hypothetical protein